MTAPIETPPDGLRAALEDMVTKADRRAAERDEAGRDKIPARVDVEAIRGLLAEFPAEQDWKLLDHLREVKAAGYVVTLPLAPVANPDRVAEVLREVFSTDDGRPVTWGAAASALLDAGVFRDEAAVKAEALEQAATAALTPMVERVALMVERLAAAENVCAMLATAADGIDEDTRHKATAVLWQEWAAQPDVSLDPAAFPHLTKPVAERLAAMLTTSQETRT